MRLPLIGGAYQARSIIANAQRCVNYYPEVNQKDALVPLTHYQRPGLRSLVVPPVVAPGRGLYRASNGNGYCIIGQHVYAISPNWVLTEIGELLTPLTTLTSMIDNGTTIVLVDNSANGYTIDLATNAFAQISDPTGTFNGATRVDYIDTFILWNMPGTINFGSTLSNEITFDALYFAGKTDYPDLLQSIIVNRHEIILPGTLKTETWYDAGNAGFPFAELPGMYTEHGTVAPFSLASQDICVFWLGQDLQGQGVVFMQRGYECRRISTHAIELAIQSYPTITDAIAYTYQQQGHVFYVLTFPNGNATWVYDAATELWHQRAWLDDNGQLNRERVNCAAFINGLNVALDWQNGTLYAMDLNHYTDDVNGVAGPIRYIRGFPHIGNAIAPNGQLVETDSRRLRMDSFTLDLECGLGPQTSDGKPAQVSMRWSLDRGRTYGNEVLQSAGDPGQYRTIPLWRGLGSDVRDPIFEISHSIAGPAALNGAWLNAEVLGS